jgi:3-isopropylmalate dehydratase small subunit
MNKENGAVMRETRIRGRVWVIADANGTLIDDIDTDQIYHNQHLAVTEVAEMGRYAFGNLAGWEDFPNKAQAGDIVIVGKNFGAGSSRQHAVDCFRALGIALIVGESFGAIYKRNAINSGFPILECPDIVRASLRSGDIVEANLGTGEIIIKDGRETVGANPFSPVQMDIYQAGDLFRYAKAEAQNRKR